VSSEDTGRYRALFPTIWSAATIEELQQQIDRLEVDLLIIYPGVESASWWPDGVHVICFSQDMTSLPGPIGSSKITIGVRVETEESLLPALPLPMAERRDADLRGFDNIKDWLELDLDFVPSLALKARGDEAIAAARKMFVDGALVLERHSKTPLATEFTRSDDGLGVAWLPHPSFSRTHWVELICAKWATSDSQRFPGFGDWTQDPEWMVDDEAEVLLEINLLEQQKRSALAELDSRLDQLRERLTQARDQADSGRRRLLTAQGEHLVSQVANTLREIGFDVEDVDPSLPEGVPRREDLRLRLDVNPHDDWVAIVEVRGYGSSGGKTYDLTRLERFARLYEKETGNPPAKQIYVINNSLDLPPAQRPEPLASASEDVQVFAEAPGLIVSTLDLFRVVRDSSDTAALAEARDSIRNSVGRWIQEGRASSE
jgi:hypothetical protein